MKAYAVLLAPLLWLSGANAKTFQYLYIEANEGAASGGHVAVQFDDEVFHYQYSDGLTRLSKDDGDAFRFDYRYLQNRPVHVADIEVADARFAVLQDHFKRQFWDQHRQFKRLQALKNDHRFLTVLSTTQKDVRQPMPADSGLTLPGAGLFYSGQDFAGGSPIATSDSCQTQDAARTILTRLRTRLQQRREPDFLQQRMQDLTQNILNLTPPTAEQASRPDYYGMSGRYQDLVNALLALKTIQESRALTGDACHALDRTRWPLQPEHLRVLSGYQQRLLISAESLIASKRPDWGQALFVTLARLVVLQQSIDSGRWVFLDDFSADAKIISTSAFDNQSEAMHRQYRLAEQHWRQLWQDLSSHAELNDLTYTDLELAANRHHEWHGGLTRHTLRHQGQQALPLKPLTPPLLLKPDISTAQLQQSLQTLESLISAATADLEHQYAYDLLTRNCVTELFRGISLALTDEIEHGIDDRIAPDGHFVPFVAFARLQAHYPVTQTYLQASYRQQQLSQDYAQAFPPWVYLRESNIFSAEYYHYNPDDAAFVFFTDDGFWLRPLFGAVNTLTGMGQSLLGLLAWPFDDGARLNNGARGLLMSLPELAFVNIRKGSYQFAPPVQESLPASAP